MGSFTGVDVSVHRRTREWKRAISSATTMAAVYTVCVCVCVCVLVVRVGLSRYFKIKQEMKMCHVTIQCVRLSVWIRERVRTFCWEIIPEMKGSVANDEILSRKVQDLTDFGPLALLVTFNR